MASFDISHLHMSCSFTGTGITTSTTGTCSSAFLTSSAAVRTSAQVFSNFLAFVGYHNFTSSIKLIIVLPLVAFHVNMLLHLQFQRIYQNRIVFLLLLRLVVPP